MMNDPGISTLRIADWLHQDLLYKAGLPTVSDDSAKGEGPSYLAIDTFSGNDETGKLPEESVADVSTSGSELR